MRAPVSPIKRLPLNFTELDFNRWCRGGGVEGGGCWVVKLGCETCRRKQYADLGFTSCLSR